MPIYVRVSGANRQVREVYSGGKKCKEVYARVSGVNRLVFGDSRNWSNFSWSGLSGKSGHRFQNTDSQQTKTLSYSPASSGFYVQSGDKITIYATIEHTWDNIVGDKSWDGYSLSWGSLASGEWSCYGGDSEGTTGRLTVCGTSQNQSNLTDNYDYSVTATASSYVGTIPNLVIKIPGLEAGSSAYASIYLEISVNGVEIL